MNNVLKYMNLGYYRCY